MEKMTLYLLTTKGLGDFYVVEKCPTSAKIKLETLLKKSDYGFYEDRRIINIKILATELDFFPEDKPSFSNRYSQIILPTIGS